MKQIEKIHELKNSGILIQLNKTPLKVGEITFLIITWLPKSTKYTKILTEEQHTIHLEVNLIIF